MKGNTEKLNPGERGVYSVVWRYKVKPENREKFEFEYGSRGSWYRLFSESKGYTGSFLHISEDEPGTYLLVDSWTDQQSYEEFKRSHAEMYDEMSRKFETLYESEERIGAFSRVEQ